MAVNKNNQGKVNQLPGPGNRAFAASGVCYFCGDALGNEELFICAACNNDLPVNSPACPRCALPVSVAGASCGNCLATAGHAPGSFLVLFPYAFPINRLIHDLKFHARIEIAWILGSWMATAAALAGAPMPQCLVPVPLHKYRVAERGYNQSLEIARAAGSLLDIPVRHDLCRRTVNTPPQSSVNAGARAKNIRGAFAIAERRCPLPEHVALVDDVITTGATVNELAGVLCNEGIARVDVWAAARTLPGRDLQAAAEP